MDTELPARSNRRSHNWRACPATNDLLKDEKLREEMGHKARQTVREKFLLTRYVEEYLDLFGTFDNNRRLPD